MASLGELFVTVGANIQGFKDAMTTVSTQLNKVDAEAQKATSGFSKLSDRLSTMGMGLTAAVTAPIVGLSVAVANVAGAFEQTQTAFTAFLGSADKANSFLSELKAFAAVTPFEFTGLTDAAKRMMAFGFASEQVLPMLRTIGDAVAGIGAGKEGIDRVTLALGQMQAKGKVMAQEMNQLAELGIPAWKMLADRIGVSIPEAMKMAENGAIAASVAIPAILDGMNQKFGGLMEKQSKTMLGMWSNFKDQVTFTLMDLGTVLLPIFKDMLNAALPLVTAVKHMAQGFSELPKPVQNFTLGLTALAASLGPLLLLTGSVLGAITKIAVALPLVTTALGGLTMAFSSVNTALQLGMISALTKTELALLGVSAAAAGAMGVFLGWQIGSWAYSNIPAVKALGDTIADVALIQIPYLENAIFKLTGVTAKQKQSSEDLDFATAKLEKSLKAHGVTVDRGTMSSEQYSIALREAAKELGKTNKSTESVASATERLRKILEKVKKGVALTSQETEIYTKHQEELKKQQEEAKKAAEALKKAYQQLGLKDLGKEADELKDAIDLLKRSGDWHKLTVDQQREATDKLNDALLQAKGFAYNWQQALVGLTTQQDAARRSTEAMFMSMEQIGQGIEGVSTKIEDMPMGEINEELMSQAQAAAQAAGDIHRLESAYNKADLKNKNAIYEMLRDQITAAEEAGETVPEEQRKMLEKMGKDLGRGGKLDDIKDQWGDFSKEVSTIITNLAQDISDSLWDGDMSWGEKGKTLLKDLGKAVTSLFITPAVEAIAGFVTNTINGLLKGAFENVGGWLGSLGSRMAGIFGGGVDAASGAAGAAGAAGSAGSAGSSAAGGAMAAAGLATGIVGAISSIVGNFQSMAMNKSLDLIENSTRYTKIYLGDLLPKLVNEFAPGIPLIHQYMIGDMQSVMTRQLTELETIKTNTGGGGGGGAAASIKNAVDELAAEVPEVARSWGERAGKPVTDATELLRIVLHDWSNRVKNSTASARDVMDAVARSWGDKVGKPLVDAAEVMNARTRDWGDRLTVGASRLTQAVDLIPSKFDAVARDWSDRVKGSTERLTQAVDLIPSKFDAVARDWSGRVKDNSRTVESVSSQNFGGIAQEERIAAIERGVFWIGGMIAEALAGMRRAFETILPEIHARLLEMRVFGLGVFPQPGFDGGMWDPSIMRSWANRVTDTMISGVEWGSIGGSGVTIQIQGNVIGTDDAAQTFADIIAEKLALQGGGG